MIRVSSIQDKKPRGQLNRVIESLDCFVSCTTNDETEQNYGVISYAGPIYKGQIIKGNKKAHKSGTPVVVSNTYIGMIKSSGDLEVENTCYAQSCSCTCNWWSLAQGCINYTNSGSSYKTVTPMHLVSTCTQCFTCVDDQGRNYIKEVTTCDWKCTVNENCHYTNVFPGNKMAEDAYCYIYNKYASSLCCDCARITNTCVHCLGYVDDPGGGIVYCYNVKITYEWLDIWGFMHCDWETYDKKSGIITTGIDAQVEGWNFCEPPPPNDPWFDKQKTIFAGDTTGMNFCSVLDRCCRVVITRDLRPIDNIEIYSRYY